MSSPRRTPSRELNTKTPRISTDGLATDKDRRNTANYNSQTTRPPVDRNGGPPAELCHEWNYLLAGGSQMQEAQARRHSGLGRPRTQKKRRPDSPSPKGVGRADVGSKDDAPGRQGQDHPTTPPTKRQRANDVEIINRRLTAPRPSGYPSIPQYQPRTNHSFQPGPRIDDERLSPSRFSVQPGFYRPDSAINWAIAPPGEWNTRATISYGSPSTRSAAQPRPSRIEDNQNQFIRQYGLSPSWLNSIPSDSGAPTIYKMNASGRWSDCPMMAVCVTEAHGAGEAHPVRAVEHPKAKYNYIHGNKTAELGWTPMPMPPVSIEDFITELGRLVPIGWLRLRVKFEGGAVRLLGCYVIDCPEFSEIILAQPSSISRSEAQGQQSTVRSGSPSRDKMPLRRDGASKMGSTLTGDLSAGSAYQAYGSASSGGLSASTYQLPTPANLDESSTLTPTTLTLSLGEPSSMALVYPTSEGGKPTAVMNPWDLDGGEFGNFLDDFS